MVINIIIDALRQTEKIIQHERKSKQASVPPGEANKVPPGGAKCRQEGQSDARRDKKNVNHIQQGQLGNWILICFEI